MAVGDVVQARSNWPLQDAKARFSELVRRAREQGPQHVSVRGEPAVVVVSEEEFTRLTSLRRSIVDHILEGEPWPDDVVDTINARSRDIGRDVIF
jgi:prevent-host-death family protein